MESKVCTRCKNEKSINDFYGCGNGRKGKQSLCKICMSEYTKEYTRMVKQRVIDAYGGKCECCGETEFCFMAVDHIKGGGNKKEGRNRGGYAFYLWLIKLGFPKEEYRLLCHNCNMGRESNGGICPHENSI